MNQNELRSNFSENKCEGPYKISKSNKKYSKQFENYIHKHAKSNRKPFS